MNTATQASAKFSTQANSGVTGVTHNTNLIASEETADVLQLSDISMSNFETALENIAYPCAGGGSTSRLNFAADSIASYTANMRAAVGRIEDVDIALESSNLAKYSILTQASAAMVAQANSSNDAALMLLR